MSVRKYIMPMLTLFLCLAFSFTACAEGTPPANNNIPEPQGVVEPTPINQPDIAQTTSTEQQNINAPYWLNEIIIYNPSVNGIVDQFGPYNYYETTYMGGILYANILLHYDDIVVELLTGDVNLPILNQEIEGEFYDYGEHDYTLTELEKATSMTPWYICWTNPDIWGPRNTHVGNTIDDVQSAFLDKAYLYEQDNEIQTLYTAKDVFAPDMLWAENAPFYGELSNITDDAKLPPFQQIQADCALTYCAGYLNDYGYEYTTYYFYQDRCTAIEQGHYHTLN